MLIHHRNLCILKKDHFGRKINRNADVWTVYEYEIEVAHVSSSYVLMQWQAHRVAGPVMVYAL